MVRVFKYLGDIVEERFRKIRRQRYEEKLEKELREKMLQEGKEKDGVVNDYENTI